MFIKVTEYDSYNRILVNTDHIVSIVESSDFDYCHIWLDVKDPDSNEDKVAIYKIRETNLHNIKSWNF